MSVHPVASEFRWGSAPQNSNIGFLWPWDVADKITEVTKLMIYIGLIGIGGILLLKALGK